MDVKRSAVHTVQAASSFGQELEEAFNEDVQADVDAQSLLDFAVDDHDGRSSEAMAPPIYADNKQMHFKVVYTAGGNMRLPTRRVVTPDKIPKSSIL